MPDIRYVVSPPVQDNGSANVADFAFFGMNFSAWPKTDAFGQT